MYLQMRKIWLSHTLVVGCQVNGNVHDLFNGTCFLRKYVFGKRKGYVAVITIVGPFRDANFFFFFSKLVVRAGLVTDDGECRDVAINGELAFSLP